METEDKFKNSPIHDKRAILEMMDKLEHKEMAKIVDYIQEQVKLFCQPAVIKSVCNHNYKPCKQGIFKHIDKCVKCNKIK